MKKFLFILTTIFIFSFSLKAQDNQSTLPKGYGNVTLGMSLDQAKESLKKNPAFGYHGDRDVSLIPGDNQMLIETDASGGYGSVFLTNCWFQFYNKQLYIITINVNTDKMDYYSMFKTFLEKYGEPFSLDPDKAIWKTEETTMILEKPLSVKYIDNKTYEEIQKKATVEISAEELTQKMFLEEF